MSTGGLHFLAIDGGTESLRAGIFNESGEKIAVSSVPYITYNPRPGWAEQDPSDWDHALVLVIKKVFERVDIPATDISAIVADATIGTLVPVDDHLQALSRAIMWMDVRAQEEYRELITLSHEAVNLMPTAEWAPCKLKWLKKNRPSLYGDSAYILEYLDWINWRLTGTVSHSSPNMSARWMIEDPSRGFDPELYEKYGIEEVSGKLEDNFVTPGEYIGELQPSFAEQSGMVASTPVFAGAPDGIAASLGTNALGDGDVMMVMGSSHCQLITIDHPRYIEGIMGPFKDCHIVGKSLLEAGQTSTGSVLKWFQRLQGDGEKKNYFSEMDEAASEVTVGSDDLLILDYFQGNRTPLRDPAARGTITGLSLNHESKHVYRAFLEGVAYGTELILERIRMSGVEVSKIVVCGGGAYSDLWLSIHASVSNMEIVVPVGLDASLLGCAILGASGSGAYPSVSQAASNMVRYARTVKPVSSEVDEYRFYFEQYKDLYQNNRDIFRKFAEKNTE